MRLALLPLPGVGDVFLGAGLVAGFEEAALEAADGGGHVAQFAVVQEGLLQPAVLRRTRGAGRG